MKLSAKHQLTALGVVIASASLPVMAAQYQMTIHNESKSALLFKAKVAKAQVWCNGKKKTGKKILCGIVPGSKLKVVYKTDQAAVDGDMQLHALMGRRSLGSCKLQFSGEGDTKHVTFSNDCSKSKVMGGIKFITNQPSVGDLKVCIKGQCM